MYITTKQVKQYLSITSTTDDALIDALIPVAQHWFEVETGRLFEVTADTTRYFDADFRGSQLFFDEDLAQAPTTVTNGDGTVLTAAQYVLEPRNSWPKYAITLRSDAGVSWTYSTYWEQAISITGRWGFCITPPQDIVQGVRRMVAWLYKQKDSQIFAATSTPEFGQISVPQGIPKDISLLAKRYRKAL
jgi:hypothetical protein